MIDRYSREKLKDLFSLENKFKAYLTVEIKVLEAWNKLGVIPIDDVEKIKRNVKLDVNKILEIEKETKHDVIAFTRSLSLSLGEEAKWIHYGLTSTDVVDTAQGYILKQVNDIIENDIIEFMDVLKKQALKYKNTPCIGRTHGIHADITSFGLKWVLWHEEMKRNLRRFRDARKDIECGKISGAVGNFANIDPFIEEYVCNSLGINHANISTQVLQRDRHAYYVSILSLISDTLEQIAIEIRGLQRTEVGEVLESFSKSQKGSSAMPHKQNPITSENICGCARIMRGYMVSMSEDVALWHERDISHSSVERVVLADAATLLDYMLNRYKNLLDNLIVKEDKMLKNIYITKKVIFSQRVMNALINKGLKREDAYDLVQKIALNSFQNDLDFEEELYKNNKITSLLTKEEIKESFTLDYYFKNVDYIYNRCDIKEQK